MSQHISRPTYRPADGFLGVYLEEGAPLVDADVNEAQDIHWNLVRAVARDAGLIGTRGATFAVSAGSVERDDEGGVGFALCLRGCDRPFYVGGIPVVHRVRRSVRARAEARTYVVSLLVQVDEVSYIDRPRLRDPAIQASSHGSYRRLPRATLELVARPGPGATPAPPVEAPRTEIRLTTRGVYTGLNACYRIEIADCNVHGRLVDLLWDPDNAATRTSASEVRLLGKTRSVQVDDPRGFEQGHLVRLEGPGLFERMPAWPEELVPADESVRSRCPVYEISSVFGDLLYLKEADRNRPDQVEIVAPEQASSLVVRESPCWVEKRRLLLGYFEPALLLEVQADPTGTPQLLLDGALDLAEFDASSSELVYEVCGAECEPAYTVTAVSGSTLTLSAGDEVSLEPGQPVFVYRKGLQARSISRIERSSDGRVGLKLDDVLSQELPLGPRRVHLPESQGAQGLSDLIDDYLAQAPIPTLPAPTSDHPLTGDAQAGDSVVRVADDGAWQVGRTVEIGVVERYTIQGEGTPGVDDTRFTVTTPRPQPLLPSNEQQALAVFTDAQGRTLAEVGLISLDSRCELRVQAVDDGVLKSLNDARVEIRMEVEIRRITRIQPVAPTGSSRGEHDVVLLLDRPLSLDHTAASHGVSAQDRVFLRRFRGATWDATVTGPGEDPQDVSIDRGLRVQLSRPHDRPIWRVGRGWTVWTRDMGFREALYQAPVDDPGLWRAPLAFLEVLDGEDGPSVRVTDLRAGERGCDVHEEIRVVEEQYKVEIDGVSVEETRMQATSSRDALGDDPVGRHYLERLHRALDAGDDQEARALLSALRTRRHAPGEEGE